VSDQRFHGGGGRPAFGLWATYWIAASHLFKRQCVGLMPLRSFVPITAAGQRRIHTGFPFNKAQKLCTYTHQVYKTPTDTAYMRDEIVCG
jgi:hypothetical protein